VLAINLLANRAITISRFADIGKFLNQFCYRFAKFSLNITQSGRRIFYRVM